MALLAAFLAAGCQTQELPARGRFVDDGVVVEAGGEWAGERVAVDNAGVTAEGRLSVASDTERTRVRAVARVVSLADTLDKANADLAVTDALATFTVVTEAIPGLTSVRCGHGGTHGSAAGSDSGCEMLSVSLPAGAPGRPLAVTARSGRGELVVSLGNAVLAELDARGSNGPLDVTVPTTPGAIITVVAETGNDVVLRLAPDFAADGITLEAGGAIDTSAFPDVASGRGRGEAGRGARSITVRSVGPGVVRLVSR